ncbi:MAG: ParB/RepB/Spo0J family partition protein [Oscillospiraceae bacterium]|nr:ParB/RepB/Spo0J family partition protein [Oscillospiraceae bacterium]
MSELTYIPIDKLWPHPDNPRKDLGDVSELADSIKANGVLQNLTVVKKYGELTGDFDGHYTVIIGHRRLAAAKLAGLKELPCVVAEMTSGEQLQTMLMENMQRSDLTVYEQAQGFQMMLDLGASVDEISAESGFSTSTVRRRVKLLALDKDKFKASESRGATLQDYMELDKVHDPELKNKVLDAIGTANFKNELRKAQDEEKRREFVKARVADVSPWATDMGDKDTSEFAFVRSYSWWGWTNMSVVEKPEDADTVSYYYHVSNDGVSIYIPKAEKRETEESVKRREAQEKLEQTQKMLEEITARHKAMRLEFIKNFGQAEKNRDKICNFACAAFFTCSSGSSPDIIAEMLGLDITDDTTEEEDIAMLTACPRNVFYKLLVCICAAYEDGGCNYYRRAWTGNQWVYTHYDNEEMDAWYTLLTSIGYEMSDEEKAMQDGTHELFYNGETV